MKPTKFWVILLGVILCLSAGMAVFVSQRSATGVIANIYQNGACILSVDLSQVEHAYTLAVSGPVENTVTVEHGRICVSSATCPDQVCVHQGWISNSVVPIACLPNQLIIRIEDTPGNAFDAATR